MTYTHLTRKAIESLKQKGRKWLEENIAMEKRLFTKDEPNYIRYIEAMERALKELDNSTIKS